MPKISLTLSISVAALGAMGCLTHGRGADDASVRSAIDAVAADAATSAPDALALDADVRVRCAPDEPWVTVRVEPVTSDVARCEDRHIDEASLTGVETAPEDDGLRLHFDFCPNADADCRCDVVIANVGTEHASSIAPLSSATVDLRVGDGPMLTPFVTVQRRAICDCVGCPCSFPLHFHAGSGTAFGDPSLAPGLVFTGGAQSCEPSGCEFGGSSALHVVAETGEGDIAAGSTLDLGAFHVRSLRDVEILAPCAACAGCASPYGAWLAWVDS